MTTIACGRCGRQAGYVIDGIRIYWCPWCGTVTSRQGDGTSKVVSPLILDRPSVQAALTSMVSANDRQADDDQGEEG